MTRPTRRVAFGLALGGMATLGFSYAIYRQNMRAIRQRMAAESQVMKTRCGPVEFATAGSGVPTLVAHGAGGGYDQGLLIARAFGDEGLRWVSPSRFGYLRTPLPVDGSTAAQADAFAALLDELSVERVAIVAMSGGVPPTLQFALRYPARTSALVLLSSAPYTPLTAAQQQLPIPVWLYQAIFSSDLPYWVLTKVARANLEKIFDVKPAGRANWTPEERAFLAQMLEAFAPVTQRLDGLRNEGAAIHPQASYPLERITAPTLVVHARDDGINPFAFGEYTAQHIPGAQLMPLPSGGHLLLGHHAAVRARVSAFLRHGQQVAPRASSGAGAVPSSSGGRS